MSLAAARLSDAADFDVIVVGAGVSGMYMLHRLRELGYSARVFEAGSDVGGTWYWNRYPGARFDSESWSYGYSFSEELLQEWDWKEHFSPQPDTLEYLNYVADKFDFRRDITFNARVTAAHYDETANLWTLRLESGETWRSRLLITGLGPLSAYTLPNIPGRDDFKGPAFHTSRWPKEPLDLAGKRVGVIGTGATAIQAITEIAKTAGHLTVFQRTPNWAAPLHNAKITPEEQQSIKARYDEIYARCRETIACFIHHPDPRKALETPEDEREAFWEKLYAEPGFGIWLGNFSDVLLDERANALMSEFAARKIRERVKDQTIAEKLIPKNHGFGTRRLPLESGYYEVYNQANVELVDINETPIERITETGVRTPDQTREFDVIIFATGFDGVTGPYDRIDIRGPAGRSLKDDWRELPRTMLGVMADGFPNLLMILGPHTARGNIPRNIEDIVDWLTGLLGFMKEHDHAKVAPRSEAAADWLEQVREADAPLLSSKVASWQTGVNRNVDGRQAPRVLGYNGGAARYREIGDDEAASGYKSFIFD